MMKNFFKNLKSKWGIAPLIMFSLSIIFIIVFCVALFKLNVLPILYSVIISIILVLLTILFMFLTKKKKNKVAKTFGYIISILILIITSVGFYYLVLTNGFLDKFFKSGKDTYTYTYQVLVKKDSAYSKIDDLKDQIIGYYEDIPKVKEATAELSKRINFEGKSYEDIIDNFSSLDREKINGLLIESNLYDSLQESLDTIRDKEYKTIYKFDMTFEEEVVKKEAKGNGINIYIGGPDFTGTNYDFNMIATLNKDTHKILLTSTPRDYYVQIAGKKRKDILGYAGVWGINTSMKTIENLYGVDMNYFVKINTKSLVGLVDVLDGIEFCSDIDFTTTKTMVMTYDDTKGSHLNVKKGCHNYKGMEILTIARERKVYKDGDRQRQKNCQAIIISIFNKLANMKSLTKYNEILDSISDLYKTNIPQDLFTDMSKSLVSGDKWTFEQQSVTGSDSQNYVHLGTVLDYVMVPNQDSVNKAILKIKEVMSES